MVYGGAMSLDGYIAGPNGECDWIVMDPDIDFGEMTTRFDTFLIGRKTFEAMQRMGGGGPPMPGITNIVFSRTLRPGDCPKSMTLSDDAEAVVADLRKKPGKDIAIFGGGELFRSLGGRPGRRGGVLGDPGSARRRDTNAANSRRSGPAQTEGAPGL